MGLSDKIKYDGHIYQTKSLRCVFDNYEVRDDGTLWREEYDIEDRSDPSAEGLAALFGVMTQTNKRWERDDFTGSVIASKGDATVHLFFRGGALVMDDRKRRFKLGETMQLSKLIEALSAIEQRHPGEIVEVEARDEAGFPLTNFDVVTEYILAAKRITVRFEPTKESEPT